MSKCPLRLYFNENFTFTPSTSFHTGNHASLTNCKSCLSNIVDGKALGDFDLCDEQDPFDLTPILGKYVLDHSKSIEAYRAIHTQQQDILRLCRKKLCKRYSSRFTRNIKDEDIIRALSIIQDNQLHEDDNHHIDRVLGEILNGILTDVPKRQQYVDERQNRSILARKSSSVNTINPPAQPKKYKVVFKKVKALFKRSKSFTSSYTVTSRAVASTVFKDDPDKKVVCTTKAFLGTIHKQFDDFKQQGDKAKITYITNPTIYTTTTTYQPFLGMGPKTCSCHQHLVRLQDEFVKQQSEIKLINSHLQQCLSILQEYNVKPPAIKRKKRYTYGVSPQVYAVSSTKGPFGDRKARRSDDRIVSRRSDERVVRPSDSSIRRPARYRNKGSSTDSFRRRRRRGCCPCKKKKKSKRGNGGTCSDSCQFREILSDSSETSSTTCCSSSTCSSKPRRKKKKPKRQKKKKVCSGCCRQKKKRPKRSESTLSSDCRCPHYGSRSSSSVFLHDRPNIRQRKYKKARTNSNASRCLDRATISSERLERIEPVKSSDEMVIRTICYPDTCASKHPGSPSTTNRVPSSNLLSTESFCALPCPDPVSIASTGTQYSKFGGTPKNNPQCDICGPDRGELCTCNRCVKGRMKIRRGKRKGRRHSDVSFDDKTTKRRRRNCLIRLCKFICCCPC